jgi:cell division protein FtsL
VTRPMPRRLGRPRLRLVRSSTPGRAPFLVLALVLVGIAVLGIVTMQAFVSETAFEVQKLTADNAQLQQDNAQLRLETAQLATLGHIAEEARKIGLVISSDLQTITAATPVDQGQATATRWRPGTGRPKGKP